MSVLALVLCVATTNVPEYKGAIDRACRADGAGVIYKALDLRRDGDKITWTVTYNLRVGPGVAVSRGADAAKAASLMRGIIEEAFGAQETEIVFKDSDEKELCRFRFEKGKAEPVLNRCQVGR